MLEEIRIHNNYCESLILDDLQVELKRILRNHKKNPNQETLQKVIEKLIDLYLQYKSMYNIRLTLKDHEKIMKQKTCDEIGNLLHQNSNMRNIITSYLNVLNQRIRWFNNAIENHDKIIKKSIKIKKEKEISKNRKKGFKYYFERFKEILGGEFNDQNVDD